MRDLPNELLSAIARHPRLTDQDRAALATVDRKSNQAANPQPKKQRLEAFVESAIGDESLTFDQLLDAIEMSNSRITGIQIEPRVMDACRSVARAEVKERGAPALLQLIKAVFMPRLITMDALHRQVPSAGLTLGGAIKAAQQLVTESVGFDRREAVDTLVAMELERDAANDVAKKFDFEEGSLPSEVLAAAADELAPLRARTQEDGNAMKQLVMKVFNQKLLREVDMSTNEVENGPRLGEYEIRPDQTGTSAFVPPVVNTDTYYDDDEEFFYIELNAEWFPSPEARWNFYRSCSGGLVLRFTCVGDQAEARRNECRDLKKGVAFIAAICNGLRDGWCEVDDIRLYGFEFDRELPLSDDIDRVRRAPNEPERQLRFMIMLAGAAVEASSLFSVGYKRMPIAYLHQSFADLAA